MTAGGDDRQSGGEDLRVDRDIPEGVHYDPDLAVHEPASVPVGPLEPSRRRSALLLIPFGIVALSLGVYVLFGLIASDRRSSSDYLDDIRMRRGGDWQSAFELSRMVGREDAASRPRLFVPRLLDLFEGSRFSDPRVRRYLALTIGIVGDPRGVEPLIAALDDDDLETRLYSVEGLAAIADSRAVDHLIPILDDDEPDLRKATAYALGSIGLQKAVPALRAALNDPVVDVAWNSALSLARLGDRSGVSLLARMLDREYLDSVRRPDDNNVPRPMSERQKEQALLNALAALALVGDRGHLAEMRTLRESDPSLLVRQAASVTLLAVSGD